MNSRPSPTLEPSLTPAERRALRGLQNRYRRDHDMFSPAELARLQFLSWLYDSGRLPS